MGSKGRVFSNCSRMEREGGIVNGVSEVGRVEGGFVNDVAQKVFSAGGIVYRPQVQEQQPQQQLLNY